MSLFHIKGVQPDRILLLIKYEIRNATESVELKTQIFLKRILPLLRVVIYKQTVRGLLLLFFQSHKPKISKETKCFLSQCNLDSFAGSAAALNHIASTAHEQPYSAAKRNGAFG